jgi:hypothetical protein
MVINWYLYFCTPPYWVNGLPACAGSDDDFGFDFTYNGDHDRDFGRNHCNPPNHFESTAVSSVVFSDDPAFQPGRTPRPLVDSARFYGTGKWNGRPGYTFEAIATDQGEPGLHRDRFSLVIKDPSGNVIVNFSGALDGGNIQSRRVGR